MYTLKALSDESQQDDVSGPLRIRTKCLVPFKDFAVAADRHGNVEGGSRRSLA